MTLSVLLDRVYVNTATTGQGTITLGSVKSPAFCTVAEAGGLNGDQYTYIIEEGTDFALCRGIYSSTGPTLTVATVLMSKISGVVSTAKMTLAGAATIRLVAAAEDLLSLGFPSGTLMLFQQTSAPIGWTKQTTHNDKALRVVSGTASSGGSNAFSTVMAQTVVGNTTLSTAQMPSHTHPFTATVGQQAANTAGCNQGGSTPGSSNTGAQGGGGAHNHAITMDIQYVDLIIASKN